MFDLFEKQMALYMSKVPGLLLVGFKIQMFVILRFVQDPNSWSVNFTDNVYNVIYFDIFTDIIFKPISKFCRMLQI